MAGWGIGGRGVSAGARWDNSSPLTSLSIIHTQICEVIWTTVDFGQGAPDPTASPGGGGGGGGPAPLASAALPLVQAIVPAIMGLRSRFAVAARRREAEMGAWQQRVGVGLSGGRRGCEWAKRGRRWGVTVRGKDGVDISQVGGAHINEWAPQLPYHWRSEWGGEDVLEGCGEGAGGSEAQGPRGGWDHPPTGRQPPVSHTQSPTYDLGTPFSSWTAIPHLYYAFTSELLMNVPPCQAAAVRVPARASSTTTRTVPRVWLGCSARWGRPTSASSSQQWRR